MPVLVLVAFYAIGKGIELRHLGSLDRREEELKGFLLSSSKRLPQDLVAEDAWLCKGSVVIGADHFKVFAASLKTIFGGRLGSLETVLERARREALLRMAESARQKGATLVLNVRFETATIGQIQGGKGKSSSMAEVLAYGTAVKAKSRF